MLFAKLNLSTKKIIFSGPGTFTAKDRIKSLGSARWNGVDKSWEIIGANLTEAQLSEIFPDIQIEVIGEQPENSELPSSYSVSQLSMQIKSVIKQAFAQVIYVHGVLSSVKRSSDGRVFMELAEQERPDEVLRCVIWRDEALISAGLKKAGFQLETDLQVMFAVEVDYNKKFGAVSLTVHNIVAEYTLSKVRAQRDETNERLKKEGLFAKNKEKTLSYLPVRLGIITSSSGTVINDFIDSLNAADFGFQLFWYTASVQGQNAKQEILKAFKELEKNKELDAILIFRGGGSAADLSVFNDYELAKAICLCPLPVLSAIGHQEDQSSVQDVSFQAFGVPKDLGHFFAALIINLRRDFSKNCSFIADLSLRLLKQTEKDFLNISKGIFALTNAIITTTIQNLSRLSKEFPNVVLSMLEREEKSISINIIPTLHLARQQCEFVVQRASELFKLTLNYAQRSLRENEKELLALEKIFDNVSPQQQLQRGFAIVRKLADKSVVTRAELVSAGTSLEIEFADKSIEVLVKGKS